MIGVCCWVVVCVAAAFSMPLAQASLEHKDGFDVCLSNQAKAPTRAKPTPSKKPPW